MATNKSAFNIYNQGKFGTFPQNVGKDAEVSQDLHIKMSKKIAQLTKVIYALNTKNDEHENVLQMLREQHEEQLQRLHSETKEKVEVLRSRISSELDLRKQIDTLVKSMSEREAREKQILADFEKFKHSVDNEKCRVKTEHIQKVLELTHEVRHAKSNFEEKLNLLQAQQSQLTNDKHGIIEQLTHKHALELEQIWKKLDVLKSDFDKEREKLAFDHNTAIERLKSDNDKVSEAKKQLIADYESKISKAQAFYESELQAMRDTQNSSANEQIRNLSEENAKLRKDFSFQEAQLRKVLEGALANLSLLEDETKSYNANMHQLRRELTRLEKDNASLDSQLAEIKLAGEKAHAESNVLENELLQARKSAQEQSNDLLTKSTMIGELEALRSQHELRIDHMTLEIAQLKDKITHLEKTRKQLESRSMSEMNEQSQHLEYLQKALEDERVAKETLKQRLQREMDSLQADSTQRHKELSVDYQGRFDKLLSEHRVEMETLRKRLQNEKESLSKEWDAKLRAEKDQFTAEKVEIQNLMNQVKEEMTSKLDSAQSEIVRLEALIAQNEEGLGSASSQITSLKSEITRLRTDLESARAELTKSQGLGNGLKSALEKAENEYKIAIKQAEEKLKSELGKLTSQLNSQWQDRLREECDALRKQLSAQTDAEKQSAISRLTQQREDELKAAKAGWDAQINKLTAQLASFRYDMSEKEAQYQSEIASLREQAEADCRKLRGDMYATAEEYSRKITSMEEVQREELRKLLIEKQREIQDTEKRLLDRHIESTRATMLAHESAIEALLEKAENEREIAVNDLNEKHRKYLDLLKTELQHKHSLEIEQYAHAHGAQMSAARMELDRAIEIAKQKETKYEIELSEMQDDLKRRELCIENLEIDIQTLHQAVEELGKEMENKGKEILKIRSDGNRDLKRKEDELNRSYKHKIDALSSEHLRETENILEQFNRAQDLLKDKILQMQLALQETEMRLANRESRTEDLEMIAQLRDSLNDREQNLKRLIEEKRYFQLELVNRETNFNKVFNAAPNVGIMNPLVKKRKPSLEKNKGGNICNSPSPGSYTKLQPLPNSPLHDERLNPVRPLPPAHVQQKQFVK